MLVVKKQRLVLLFVLRKTEKFMMMNSVFQRYHYYLGPVNLKNVKLNGLHLNGVNAQRPAVKAFNHVLFCVENSMVKPLPK